MNKINKNIFVVLIIFASNINASMWDHKPFCLLYSSDKYAEDEYNDLHKKTKDDELSKKVRALKICEDYNFYQRFAIVKAALEVLILHSFLPKGSFTFKPYIKDIKSMLMSSFILLDLILTPNLILKYERIKRRAQRDIHFGKFITLIRT